MADPEDHLKWAKQAFDEAELLARTGKFRWATVAYFYSALHMIHTALPGLAGIPTAHQHPDAHSGPDGTQTVVRLYARSLDLPYRSLFNTSVSVRYHGGLVERKLLDRHRQDDLPPIGQWTCEQYHGGNCGCWLLAL